MVHKRRHPSKGANSELCVSCPQRHLDVFGKAVVNVMSTKGAAVLQTSHLVIENFVVMSSIMRTTACAATTFSDAIQASIELNVLIISVSPLAAFLNNSLGFMNEFTVYKQTNTYWKYNSIKSSVARTDVLSARSLFVRCSRKPTRPAALTAISRISMQHGDTHRRFNRVSMCKHSLQKDSQDCHQMSSICSGKYLRLGT